MEKIVLSLFGRRFGYSTKEIKKITEELQEKSERESLFIWLKRDDNTWLEH